MYSVNVTFIVDKFDAEEKDKTPFLHTCTCTFINSCIIYHLLPYPLHITILRYLTCPSRPSSLPTYLINLPRIDSRDADMHTLSLSSGISMNPLKMPLQALPFVFHNSLLPPTISLSRNCATYWQLYCTSRFSKHQQWKTIHPSPQLSS